MGRPKKQYVCKVRDVSKLFEEFVKTLKQYMAEKGMNNADLSRELGQQESYVTHYLGEIKKGKYPYMGFLEEVADYFDAGIVYKNGYYYMARLPEGVN